MQRDPPMAVYTQFAKNTANSTTTNVEWRVNGMEGAQARAHHDTPRPPPMSYIAGGYRDSACYHSMPSPQIKTCGIACFWR